MAWNCGSPIDPYTEPTQHFVREIADACFERYIAIGQQPKWLVGNKWPDHLPISDALIAAYGWGGGGPAWWSKVAYQDPYDEFHLLPTVAPGEVFRKSDLIHFFRIYLQALIAASIVDTDERPPVAARPKIEGQFRMDVKDYGISAQAVTEYWQNIYMLPGPAVPPSMKNVEAWRARDLWEHLWGTGYAYADTPTGWKDWHKPYSSMGVYAEIGGYVWTDLQKVINHLIWVRKWWDSNNRTTRDSHWRLEVSGNTLPEEVKGNGFGYLGYGVDGLGLFNNGDPLIIWGKCRIPVIQNIFDLTYEGPPDWGPGEALGSYGEAKITPRYLEYADTYEYHPDGGMHVFDAINITQRYSHKAHISDALESLSLIGINDCLYHISLVWSMPEVSDPLRQPQYPDYPLKFRIRLAKQPDNMDEWTNMTRWVDIEINSDHYETLSEDSPSIGFVQYLSSCSLPTDFENTFVCFMHEWPFSGIPLPNTFDEAWMKIDPGEGPLDPSPPPYWHFALPAPTTNPWSGYYKCEAFSEVVIPGLTATEPWNVGIAGAEKEGIGFICEYDFSKVP